MEDKFLLSNVVAKAMEKAKILQSRSDNTTLAYGGDWRQFSKFLESKGVQKDIRAITTGLIQDFLLDLLKEGKKIRTAHRKKMLSAIFCKVHTMTS